MTPKQSEIRTLAKQLFVATLKKMNKDNAIEMGIACYDAAEAFVNFCELREAEQRAQGKVP